MARETPEVSDGQASSSGDPVGILWGSENISRDPGFLHDCQGHMKPRGSYPTTAPLYNIADPPSTPLSLYRCLSLAPNHVPSCLSRPITSIHVHVIGLPPPRP